MQMMPFTNTLHDYEEGTYAITLTFDGSGSATSSGTRGTGNYTKIGQLVSDVVLILELLVLVAQMDKVS